MKRKMSFLVAGLLCLSLCLGAEAAGTVTDTLTVRVGYYGMEQDRYVDGTSEWDGEKYGMTYIFGDLRDWYPTSGYRNRDKGNLAGLATTRTGHYWSNYRSGNTISCFYISKKLSTGKLLQPQSSSKSDAAYGYNVRCCRE